MFNHHIFNAPVLITEHNFKVINGFPVAHKAKMSGFYDACVDWPDSNLMNFIAFHLKKRIFVLIFAHRLEPRVVERFYAEIFIKFPLKNMKGRNFICNALISLFLSPENCRSNIKLARFIVSKHNKKLYAPLAPVFAEKSDRTFVQFNNLRPQIRHAHFRNVFEVYFCIICCF